MGSFTDTYENLVLDKLFGSGAAVAGVIPGTIYACLFTVAPTDSTPGTEVANANGYARVAVANTAFTAAAGGSNSNSADVTFPQATGSWGTVVAMGWISSGTYGAGTLIAWCALTTPRAIADENTPYFPAGSIVNSLD